MVCLYQNFQHSPIFTTSPSISKSAHFIHFLLNICFYIIIEIMILVNRIKHHWIRFCMVQSDTLMECNHSKFWFSSVPDTAPYFRFHNECNVTCMETQQQLLLILQLLSSRLSELLKGLIYSLSQKKHWYMVLKSQCAYLDLQSSV